MFRSRKSRRYVSRPKRNAERRVRAGTSSIAGASQVAAVTYTAPDAQTVKSIKLDLGVVGGIDGGLYNIPYVLVRVPEGYNPNTILYPAISNDMYNPTEQVIISGVLTDTGTEDHKYNSYGRKMKEGDRLMLICFNASNDTVTVSFELSFSVLS